ncbi:OLC1v1000288C1 [Oldenlandia corymbosa var. corymbosa]|uniref:OLC1v1000288C1 n=1 Tax=Oldenlandia corymbosa var. corymbosa TaxID=529605 RepID=A0AAV1D2E9_OLDCO|nr:OLC1v1000288C1 [Oldenlandia corymbosa var. corymbosa]
MECFSYFRDRTKCTKQRSAPIFSFPSKSGNSSTEKVDESSSSTITLRGAKSSGSATSRRSVSELYEEKGQYLRVFSFGDLAQATNNFNRMLKIGEGGFGSVYRGTIKPVGGKGDPTVVAIKKLNRDGFQGHKQWVAEVQFLGVVEHPNLVKLIGYCAVDGDRGIQRLLVYEFVQNKSLEDHLFNKAYPALTWETRLQIALGAAEGLAYLHEELEVQVIFRDFKTSNILLDEDFKPKLSDFGLAREGPTGEQTHVSTAVVGTYGYAAPDYIETGHLTAKSDVWSFGVVLYEMLTGRRSLERNRPKSEQKLLEWVKMYPANNRRFGVIMDPRLESQYSLSAARAVAKLADSCLVKSARDRPNMSEVVEKLKQIIRVSGEETSPSPEGSREDVEISSAEEKPPRRMGVSESAKRRMAHLVKLSEHVDGARGRRFLIKQRQ